jgi:DinB family protein
MATGKPGPVIPDRYRAALGKADPLESMRYAPRRIQKLVQGLSERELARRPAPGKWSIKEILGHLADGEMIVGSRIRFAAAIDRPPMPGYDQDAFVERLGLERVDSSDLLVAFALARALNVALLERLPKAAWKRVGVHSERGEESIRTMAILNAGHDRIHERQIAELRKGLVAPAAAGRARAGRARKPARVR